MELRMELRMELLVGPCGAVRCLYGEAIALPKLGRLTIRRGSHIEPDECGRWHADLAPVGGPRLGPFALRSEALSAEQRWLRTHWLTSHDPDREPDQEPDRG